jgi:hypothetical protein
MISYNHSTRPLCSKIAKALKVKEEKRKLKIDMIMNIFRI